MKYNPLSWFFTRPHGTLGRQVMGYYWRMVTLILVGLFVFFPDLSANYPGFFPRVESRFPDSHEVPWYFLAMATVAVYAIVFFVISLPLQLIRLFVWYIVGPSEEQVRELNEFIKKENEQRRRAHEEGVAREKAVNIIKLSPDDSARIKSIRSTAGDVYILIAVLSVSAVVLAMWILPSYLRENAVGPWVVFADIIEALPVNILCGGLLLFFMLFVPVSLFVKKKEKEVVQGRYIWKDGVENRLHLVE